ncbi:hypothetical protein ANCDUO_01755 [Ancylostoma duodenale]|uniref:Uncharacterized protein n=1 Tax=Ancylostoma duodenale TaxID=51022 RepID=A0A0C2HEF1_9BILA|nr:hypothetical protein ANCDUO_01755 [Ancylostoma duodenale]
MERSLVALANDGFVVGNQEHIFNDSSLLSSKTVGGVGVLVNTNLVMNNDSFEQLTTRIGRLQLRRCGSIPALTIFVAPSNIQLRRGGD